MQRAAAAAWRAIRLRFPACDSMLVFCGPGNNGGDAAMVAALAAYAGWRVQIFRVGRAPRPDSAAAVALEMLVQHPVEQLQTLPITVSSQTILVDGLLGIGLCRQLRAEFAAAVHWMNASGASIVALDIPSGLDADSGGIRGVAVKAAQTICFLARKQGLYSGSAAAHLGQLVFDDLGAPFEPAVLSSSSLVGKRYLQRLKPRAPDSHKGQFGHLLILGGNQGMHGAAVLAARSALCAGAGLVTLGTRESLAATMAGSTPELMCVAASEPAALSVKPTVIAVGPGLGSDQWANRVMNWALAQTKPLVIDADGLNWLARQATVRAGVNWVLTPHPGEAARLLNTTVDEVQADRFAAVVALQQRYGGMVILKGNGSLIAGPAGVHVCGTGNAAMAAAGMGDALTGIVASLLGQGYPAEEAAILAAVWHGASGDYCARDSRISVSPTQLIQSMAKALADV